MKGLTKLLSDVFAILKGWFNDGIAKRVYGEESVSQLGK